MSDMNLDFETWYDILKDAAKSIGQSVADVEAWREEFEAGKWPEQAIKDEFG